MSGWSQRCHSAARKSGRCAARGSSSEGRPKQTVDLVANLASRQAVAQLQFDETEEQRIERTPGSQELLGDVREPVGGGDHPGERGNLAARSLGVADGRSPAAGQGRPIHGRTKTAPVMPEAA